MPPIPIQNIRLLDEVDISTRLIKKGFSGIQQISGGNDFHHPPILLISSGFERFMKCIICYWELKVNGDYPSRNILRRKSGRNGHDLNILLQNIIDICNQFESYEDRPATRDDLDFLINNARIHRIIEILSDFAQGGRYYNLDVVTENASRFEEPKDKWGELETEIVTEYPELLKLMKDPRKSDEMYKRISTILMTYLERFTRALSRIFTLGELHEDAARCHAYISDFLNIMDDKLGENKY